MNQTTAYISVAEMRHLRGAPSLATIYTAVRRGDLPSFRLGCTIMRRDDVFTWLGQRGRH